MTEPGLSEIAIVGLAGRFPGASDADALWRRLRAGAESIARFSAEELAAAGVAPELIRDPDYVPARGILDDASGFDAAFFGVRPREAEMLDPQHRIFLECAQAALDDAGYDPDRFAGPIGVFAGAGLSAWALSRLASGIGDLETLLANDRDFLATRVSYKLNLRGPSLSLQTACSTSLVAVHYACQSLLNGECELALAGGVSVAVPQRVGYLHQPEGILSPDGHCRAFDADAAGTVPGSGAGIVVLKRLPEALEEGDAVRAVIKGSAVNNDGSGKLAYTAPGIRGQAEVVREALAVAGVEPATVTYVEAHGTGTALGDPAEVAALTRAFAAGPGDRNRCALGSLKSNVGHLDAASGVAGLIKTVLALEHGELPPTLHFRAPNPEIDFAAGPFYVHAELLPWPRGETPRRAGVSSFGIGGTNAHLVVEEAPGPAPVAAATPPHLLVLSARTPAALETAAGDLRRHLDRPSTAAGEASLADVAYTLQLGRRVFEHRRAVVCHDLETARQGLAEAPGTLAGRAPAGEPAAVFVFPGQGSQRVNAGRGLYRDRPGFRRAVDRCCELLRPHLGLDLRRVLYPDPGGEAAAEQRLARTALTQPAIFVIDYALARLWMESGVRPDAMIGHSLGEYVAACLAGVLELDAALELVALRGRLIQELPAGAMLSVGAGAERVAGWLEPGVELAAVNAPDRCTVSGPEAAIEELAARLSARGLACRRLAVSHAFHSVAMEPVLEQLAAAVAQARPGAPRIPYLSCVSGSWITSREAASPEYWARQLRSTVRFADGLEILRLEPDRLFLEVGPPGGLPGLIGRLAGAPEALASLPAPGSAVGDADFWLGSLGRLWLAGCDVDWRVLHAGCRRRRVALPSYPFERRSPPAADGRGLPASAEPRPRLEAALVPPGNDLERRILELWQRRLGFDGLGIRDDFLELGGDSLTAVQVIARLRRDLGVELTLAQFFAAGTVEDLAAAVAATGERPPAPAGELDELEEGEL